MAARRPQLPLRQPSSRLPLVRVATHRRRRLSDKIRAAFHTACDDRTVEMAARLLGHLEDLIYRPPLLPVDIDRRQPESLVAVRERLANLRWRIEAD